MFILVSLIKEVEMKFSIKVWVLTLTLHLIDIDPSDGNVMIGLEVSWK